jgi:peroxiredoxin
MTRLVRWLAVVGIAAYLGWSTFDNDDRASVKPEPERKAAPNFKLTDSSGAPFQLSDDRGKVVLLNFWATWCGPCKEEIPWLISFQQEFKDRNFEVLGVSMDERGWDAVNPYIHRRKINYRVVIGSEELSLLYGGVDALPTTFMIDRDGRIARMHVGLARQSTYRREILDLLGSPHNETKQSGVATAPGLLVFVRPE